MDGHAMTGDRAAQAAIRFVERITSFTTRLLIGVGVVSIGSFLLGLAALDGGIEKVWIGLGGLFMVLAVLAAFNARRRAGRVRRYLPDITAELRTKMTGGTAAGPTGADLSAYESASGWTVISSRQFGGFRALGVESTGGSRVSDATSSVTRIPFLALAAIAISIVFAMLAPIFLLALAL